MQHAFVRLSTFAGALLLLGGTSACVDASRVDALDASVARMRAESAQHDQEIGWLRWGQMVLAGQVYGHTADRDVLARKLAALEAENAELTARLDRAEQRRDDAEPPSHDGAAIVPAQRVLDETVPYGGFAAPSRPGKRPPPPTRAVSAHARRLDETVPYGARSSDARSSDAKVFPRVLDETVPY